MIDYDNETIYTIEEIKEIVTKIIKEHYNMVNKVILFGSYAKGTAEPTSDFDLLVVDSPEFVKLQTVGFRYELMEKSKKFVDLFIEKNVDKNSELYKNMINKGVIIYE